MININSSTPIIGIYKITSPSGKIYIGQSVNIALRWNQYKLLYKTIMGPKLYHSLKKYGCDNHTFEVIEECNVNQLDEREIYWGQHYNVLTEAGLNLKLGESNGYYSDETKQKMSEAMMGRKITWKAGRRKGYVMTEEQKILHRKPKSEETRQRMRKPKSEQHIQNMRKPKPKEFGLKISKPVLQYNIDGTFIKEWSSIKEANIYTKVNRSNISACCKHRYKTAGNFIWKYKDVLEKQS